MDIELNVLLCRTKKYSFIYLRFVSTNKRKYNKINEYFTNENSI